MVMGMRMRERQARRCNDGGRGRVLNQGDLKQLLRLSGIVIVDHAGDTEIRWR